MDRFFNNRLRCGYTVSAAAEEYKPHKHSSDKESIPVSRSFAMNMFRGQMVLEQIFPFPQHFRLRNDGMLPFKEVNNPGKNDEMADFDPKVISSLKEMGAFGLQVPTKYGGLGLSNTQYTRLVEVVGANDLSVATMMGAHQSIGFKGILLYGTPEQKQKYLPNLATGKHIAAFCLTEPSSGSDAGSCSAFTRREILHFKRGHCVAMLHFYQTCLQTPVKSSDGVTKEKISAFFVERAFGGVTSGPAESKMGIKASNTTEVYFDNVKVPVDCLIGKEGEGFKVAMNILNNGRFGIAAAMSGTMKFCIKKAIDHANVRTQFGQRLVEFGAIREKIAAMVLRHYATESMAYMISGIMDQGSSEFQLEAAMSKIYSSESAWFVCDECIQILGGMGYMKECGLEKVMRDLRIVRIYEGTNEILRLFIALFGIEALKSPLASYGLIRDEVIRRAKRSPNSNRQKHCRATFLTYLVEMFGATVEELLIKYGKSIIDKQFILTPLADAAIEIFAMAVVISRAKLSLELNRPSANYEKNLCQLFCRKVSFLFYGKINSRKSNEEIGEKIVELTLLLTIVQKTPLNI
ncbi:very long chain specific acyl coenzyme A dehydrog enase [Trichuris trichiura]|uniref:Very long chain specific acyl coenzyme A dehydrog enase n=1 Tax=Trichuris trichiura TaxID=36087 RepID=A0A077ZIT9_TRITR|nr:very long chain specific acyl coenzyme A dehydrog enase [Trichuris trichiura]